jgi:hypothetical protein
MEELLKRPQSIRMLLALAKEGPMNQRTFDFHSHLAPRHGRTLREWMEERGLVLVDEEPVPRATREIKIHLSKHGEDLAQLFAKAEPMLEAARKLAKKRT